MHLLKYCLIESKGNHFYSIFLVLIIVFFYSKNHQFLEKYHPTSMSTSPFNMDIKKSRIKKSLKMHCFNSLRKWSNIPHNINNIYIRTNANDVTEGPERYRLRLQ